MSDQSAKSLTKTWLGPGKKVRKTKKVKIGDQVYLWFIAEGDDVATRHHAVITKVFQKSFQAECDDGSVWKQVLIELVVAVPPKAQNPNHPGCERGSKRYIFLPSGGRDAPRGEQGRQSTP